jgi:hypothetical protein
MSDLKVEELSLEDLKASEADQDQEDKGPGGLRAGGLGPEGSRYSPPDAPRRATFKPVLAAILIITSAFIGVYAIGIQLTLESTVEGEHFNLRGVVMDLDAAQDNREVPVAGVNISVEGIDLTEVSDPNGKFSYPDIPGGKYTITFHKRDWDESVNTRYITYIFADYTEGDDRLNFFVEVKDLDTQHSRPIPDVGPQLQTWVKDWTGNTVDLGVAVSAFDADLSTHTIALSEDGVTWLASDEHPYHTHVAFTFAEDSETADHSRLFVKVLDADRTEYIAKTEVPIPYHPFGEDGWEYTQFPEVSLFVRGTAITATEARQVLVRSGGATEFTYRIDGGDWQPWQDIANEEFTFSSNMTVGSHLVEVMARNATEVNSSIADVTITIDVTPPTVDPAPSKGPAVTDAVTIYPNSEEAALLRYWLHDGGWSAWQLPTEEVLVPIDDSGDETIVNFEVIDWAGNQANDTTAVAVEHLAETEADAYGEFQQSLRLCLPIMGIGTVLAFLGGYMSFKRKRPTLAMIGCIGALLATGFGLIGAILAFVALALVMISREEFELPAPAPEE